MRGRVSHRNREVFVGKGTKLTVPYTRILSVSLYVSAADPAAPRRVESEKEGELVMDFIFLGAPGQIDEREERGLATASSCAYNVGARSQDGRYRPSQSTYWFLVPYGVVTGYIIGFLLSMAFIMVRSHVKIKVIALVQASLDTVVPWTPSRVPRSGVQRLAVEG